MDWKKSSLIILPIFTVFLGIALLIRHLPGSEGGAVDDARFSSEETPSASDSASLANPATIYCREQGGEPLTRQEEGKRVSLCQFDNGAVCDQWDFFHRKCFSQAPPITINKQATYSAVLRTSLGDLTIELFADKTPITVNNFVFLASRGFYDQVVFHRIIKNFMIQTGDPRGTGAGGPGYQFDDELPIIRSYERGVVAMANAGPDTNGSQFFIVTKDQPDLPKNYVIFGQVVDGYSVLDKLARVPVERGATGELSSPKTPPVIESVTIYEEGKELDNREF